METILTSFNVVIDIRSLEEQKRNSLLLNHTNCQVIFKPILSLLAQAAMSVMERMVNHSALTSLLAQ
jgi:hypothetical protein